MDARVRSQIRLPSRSETIWARGLRHHIRIWEKVGPKKEANPTLFLMHGWLDVSLTSQFVAEKLAENWRVIAPDWRGFGYSGWNHGTYWFMDYLADLDAILAHYSPDEPVYLAGHSMGAQAVGLYAGVRAQRVKALAILDGLIVPDGPADLAPKTVGKWLKQLREPPQQKTYDSLDDLAERIAKNHPRLSAERALFVAAAWSHENAAGERALLADPWHRIHGPILPRAAEMKAIWSQVNCPIICVDAGQSHFFNRSKPGEREERKACFSQLETVVIQQAGHMIHFDEPEELAQVLDQFFTGCLAATQSGSDQIPAAEVVS